MHDLKKQKAKKVCFKTKRVCVRKNECRKRNDSKNDAKRSFFRKREGVITRKILYNTAVFASFIENWSTIDNEF